MEVGAPAAAGGARVRARARSINPFPSPLTWTPAKGYWAWGVKSAATADYSAGSSPLYRFRAP